MLGDRAGAGWRPAPWPKHLATGLGRRGATEGVVGSPLKTNETALEEERVSPVWPEGRPRPGTSCSGGVSVVPPRPRPHKGRGLVCVSRSSLPCTPAATASRYAPRSQCSPAARRWPWPAGCPSRDLPGDTHGVRWAGGHCIPAGRQGLGTPSAARQASPPHRPGPGLGVGPGPEAPPLGSLPGKGTPLPSLW